MLCTPTTQFCYFAGLPQCRENVEHQCATSDFLWEDLDRKEK